jgi:hypothetical protein
LTAGIGETLDVGDVEARVADRLDEPRLGVVLGGIDEALDVGRLDEPDRDAEALERVQEDVPGAAVE